LTYSIFIPTLPENINSLERTLESINSHIQISIEVIVSSHLHSQQIQALVSKYPFAKYLSFPESSNGSKYNLYYMSQNATIGEYIVLLSDNVIVTSDWTESLVKTKGNFTCGRVSISEDSKIPRNFLNSLYSFYGETAFSSMPNILSLEDFLLVDNFIIRRDFLESISQLSTFNTFLLQLYCVDNNVDRAYDPSLHISLCVKEHKFSRDFLFNRSLELQRYYYKLNNHIGTKNRLFRVLNSFVEFFKYSTLLYFRPINDYKRFSYQLERNKIPFN